MYDLMCSYTSFLLFLYLLFMFHYTLVIDTQ